MTSGPYCYMRHPLYLTEEIAVIGVLLQYRSPAAFALVALQMALQVRRMLWAQRRRAPRLTLKHPCQVVFANQAIPAILEDVSRTGLGISCERSLPRGQCVVVKVGSRQIKGAVVWQTGTRIGLQLVASLSTDDPLFSLPSESENAS